MRRRICSAAAGIALAGAAALALSSASPATAYAPPPGAYSVAVYNVVGTAGGVYWRWGPHTSWYQAIPGYGEYDGYAVAIDCWAFGDAVGPYGDTLWYYGEQWSPTTHVGDGEGWISDHYLTTPGTAAHPQPVGPRCQGY